MVEVLDGEFDGLGSGWAGVVVDHGEWLDAEALNGRGKNGQGHSGGLTLGEAGDGLRENAVSHLGFAEMIKGEGGGFEDDAAGAGVDFGVFAAHGAGEGDGDVVGGNQNVVRGARNGLAIEELDGFVGLGSADDEGGDGLAADGDEFVVIKGVERLAGFEHEDVGEVDDGVDGAHAGFGEKNGLGGEIFGGASVGEIKHGAGIAWAEVGVGLDLEREILGRGEGRPIGFGEWEIEDASNFTGEADQAKTVGAMGEGFVLDVEDEVV